MYAVPPAWPGWPRGRLTAAAGFKLRPSEVGYKGFDLRFERGGFRIQTDALDGDDIVPDATTLLLVPL